MTRRRWIKRTRRLLYSLDDAIRQPVPVWRAPVKIGTHSGSIAVFLSAPVEGQRAVLIEDVPRGQARVNKTIPVLVERIDDIAERIFVGRA